MAIASFQPSTAAAQATTGADSGAVGKGIIFMVLAVSLFAIQNAVVKDLVGAYPVSQVVFFRYFFGLIPVLFLVARMHRGLSVLRTGMPARHLVRGLLGVGATMGIFYGFQNLPLAEATSIAFVTPIFITVLGVFLLKETVGWRRWSAILVGLGGVLIILRPGAGVIDPAALVILAACLAIALTLVMSRQMSRKECPATIAFHFTWISALVSGIAMIWHWQTPNLADLAMFLLLGLLGGSAYLLVIRAYAEAPGSIIAPFDYLHILWASVLGFLLWGDVPGLNVALGAAIVIGSGLYILHRETTLGRKPLASRKVHPRT